MRRRRVRRPELKTRRGGCLLQFLLAAIAAVVMGYFMGTVIFGHQAQRPTPSQPDTGLQQPTPAKPGTIIDDSSEQEAKDQTIVGSVLFPELHLFQVQVGAFGQKVNAERLATRLSAQGWPVELVPAGNLIQVRAGLFFGRPAAETLKVQVSTDGIQAAVVEKAITSRELNYSAQDKDLYQFAQELVVSLVEALMAAEEGRVEVAATQINELADTAKDISIANEKKEKLSTMLQNISSNLVESVPPGANAVSRGISVFVDWYQGLLSA